MDYGQGTVQEADKISKINSAALINLRINNLWIDANRHSRAGLYEKWNSDLDCIWDELSGDVVIVEKKKKKDEKKTTYEKYLELNKEVSNQIKNFPSEKNGFESYSEKDKKNIIAIYAALRKKSEFLRRLQNKQGKGSAYEEDEGF